MTAFVSRAHALEFDTHRFIVDASECGLAPGQWPERIDTELGNGQQLVAVGRDRQGGVVYRTSSCSAVSA